MLVISCLFLQPCIGNYSSLVTVISVSQLIFPWTYDLCICFNLQKKKKKREGSNEKRREGGLTEKTEKEREGGGGGVMMAGMIWTKKSGLGDILPLFLNETHL